MSLRNLGTKILKDRFPFVILQDSDNLFATFKSKCPEVGELEICDDGHEITVHVGSFTHFHIGNYEDSLSTEQKEEKVIKDLVDFLEKVFEDKIEFFGGPGRGGCREINGKPRGFFSKFFFGQKSWTWTGPSNS